MADGRALRRAWFRLHKWIGLLLAALIVPVSLTGAVLVWHEELEPLVHPDRFAVSGTATVAPGAYVRAARAALGPGDRVASLSMPEHGGPVVVSAAPARTAERPGPPPRINVHLDPPTARVLEVAPGDAGVLRVLHVLHGSLMVPGVGRRVVGWVGVAMALSTLTGLWLWFPPMGRWTRGLRWRRRPDANANLHHQLGFWIAPPLFVLSVTGAWISFPAFFGRVSGEAPGGGDRARAAARARPVAETRLDVGRVLAAAGGSEVRRVAWPTEKTPEWTLRLARGQVLVDDRTGAVRREAGPAGGGAARLMRRVHDGTGMPMLWRVVIFLGGLLPVALAVTGVAMWWRGRRRRAGPRVGVV